jgi:hypothetical protein
MSAAAKKAVSLAQKKRWAEWRKKKGKTQEGNGAVAAGRSRKKK